MSESEFAIRRSELREAGVSRGRIDAMLGSGRLERIHRGIYLLNSPVDDRPQPVHPSAARIDCLRAQAHLAACGPGGVLSHHSAAALHRFDSTGPRPSTIQISARRSCGVVGNATVVISRRRQLPESTVVEGMPCTTRAQTVLDLAAIVSMVELRRIVESALRGPDQRRPAQWRTDVLLDLIRLTSEQPHHRGAGAVLRVLATRRPDSRPTGSLPETVLLQGLESHGIEVITQPTLTVQVSPREKHTYYPDQLIAAGQALCEVDGGEHLEEHRAYADAIRQNRLVGFNVFRFPANRVLHRTDEVVSELLHHLAITPPLGTSWTIAGRTINGNENEWTVRLGIKDPID